MARIAAFVVGAVSIVIAIVLRTANVAFLVGLAFAVAASANLPVILFSLFWQRFNTTGAVTGIATGPARVDRPDPAQPKLSAATDAIFPLDQPRHPQHPARLRRRHVGTLLRKEPSAEEKFTELTVRANTGLGAEV